MSAVASPPSDLATFVNEPYADFSQLANRRLMEQALAKVRSEFGKEYDLLIAGDRRARPDKLRSVNPSVPSEIVGVHSKGNEQDARDAVEAAYAFFPKWSQFRAEERIEMLLRAAAILRKRKFEF